MNIFVYKIISIKITYRLTSILLGRQAFKNGSQIGQF